MESALDGGLQLGFIENRGQFDDPVRYAVRGKGGVTYVTGDGVIWNLVAPTPPPPRKGARRLGPDAVTRVALPGPALSQVWMTFEGAAADAVVAGEDLLKTYVNYFVGDRSRWATKVPTYDRVRWAGIYPGIDAVMSRAGGGAEYDFVVQPGADPSSIRVRFRGADAIELGDDGGLVVHTPTGTLVQAPPVATMFREHGVRREVPCAIRRLDATTFTFDAPAPTAAETLLIDPTVHYFTYLGDADSDVAMAVEVANGKAHVTGATMSSSFPVTVGSHDLSHNAV